MNKNDKKAHRGNKGIIDPRTIKDFPVYKEAELLEFLSFKMPSTPRKTLNERYADFSFKIFNSFSDGGCCLKQSFRGRTDATGLCHCD